MTTITMLAAADDQCTSCAARAASCSVRQWLSGRPCCSSCTHPVDDTEATDDHN